MNEWKTASQVENGDVLVFTDNGEEYGEEVSQRATTGDQEVLIWTDSCADHEPMVFDESALVLVNAGN